jgi:MFS family permease
MLTLKRGLLVDDFVGLVFSLLQFSSAIIVNLITSKIADKLGSKKLLNICYYLFYLITIFWIIIPSNIPIYFVAIPFILAPWGSVVSVIALSQYFLETVPKEHQVNASMLIAIGTGAISGLMGMCEDFFVCKI